MDTNAHPRWHDRVRAKKAYSVCLACRCALGAALIVWYTKTVYFAVALGLSVAAFGVVLKAYNSERTVWYSRANQLGFSGLVVVFCLLWLAWKPSLRIAGGVIIAHVVYGLNTAWRLCVFRDNAARDTSTPIDLLSYDLFDPTDFPPNQTGARLWTLVVFGCLVQNAVSRSSDRLYDKSLSGSMFAMVAVFTGIVVHCTFSILSAWSGETDWNWGSVWVFVALVGTQFIFTFINTSSTIGDFSISSNMSGLDANRWATIIVLLMVLLAIILFNAKSAYNRFNKSFFTFRRVAWVLSIATVLILHTTGIGNNGSAQHLHFHHALCAWLIFCLMVLINPSIKGRLGKLDQLVATVAMGVMINGSVIWGVADYEFIVESTGHGPSKRSRDIMVCAFIGVIVLLSLGPRKRKLLPAQAAAADKSLALLLQIQRAVAELLAKQRKTKQTKQLPPYASVEQIPMADAVEQINLYVHELQMHCC